jgi:hypothetical protein
METSGEIGAPVTFVNKIIVYLDNYWVLLNFPLMKLLYFYGLYETFHSFTVTELHSW